MVRKWPNGEWTDCIREADWAAMKAYVEGQQNRPAPVLGDSAEDRGYHGSDAELDWTPPRYGPTSIGALRT